MFVFLTACRNEARILPEFFEEFQQMIRRAALAGRTRLYVVDDLSTDRSVELLEEFQRSAIDIEVHIIRVPTNLGNQGALFFGLVQVQLEPGDTLITFDCDGEDDVAAIPSILELAAANPGKVVVIERGRRTESALFKLSFSCYKRIFRVLTRQKVIPNNFLLMPGSFAGTLQRSPLAAVHFAYAALKLHPQYVATVRDRRRRYGGQTSQNGFMLVSHGLVGLMVFFEVVVAKIFMLLFLLGGIAVGLVGCGVIMPASWLNAHRIVFWGIAFSFVIAVWLLGLLLSAAFALIFRLITFTLARAAAERLTESTLRG